jgi:hypothetical protein
MLGAQTTTASKAVDLKDPMAGELESAEAASPSRGDAEIAIILLKVLTGDVLHDNFIGHIPR